MVQRSMPVSIKSPEGDLEAISHRCDGLHILVSFCRRVLCLRMFKQRPSQGGQQLDVAETLLQDAWCSRWRCKPAQGDDAGSCRAARSAGLHSVQLRPVPGHLCVQQDWPGQSLPCSSWLHPKPELRVATARPCAYAGIAGLLLLRHGMCRPTPDSREHSDAPDSREHGELHPIWLTDWCPCPCRHPCGRWHSRASLCRRTALPLGSK